VRWGNSPLHALVHSLVQQHWLGRTLLLFPFLFRVAHLYVARRLRTHSRFVRRDCLLGSQHWSSLDMGSAGPSLRRMGGLRRGGRGSTGSTSSNGRRKNTRVRGGVAGCQGGEPAAHASHLLSQCEDALAALHLPQLLNALCEGNDVVVQQVLQQGGSRATRRLVALVALVAVVFHQAHEGGREAGGIGPTRSPLQHRQTCSSSTADPEALSSDLTQRRTDRLDATRLLHSCKIDRLDLDVRTATNDYE